MKPLFLLALLLAVYVRPVVAQGVPVESELVFSDDLSSYILAYGNLTGNGLGLVAAQPDRARSGLVLPGWGRRLRGNR